MNTEQLKAKLEAEKNVLEKELAGLGIFDAKRNDWEATPVVGGITEEPDENDKADQFEEFEERSATLSVLETRINAVNRALEKMSKGNYGMCEVCNKAIEDDRLQANPAASTCTEHMD